VSSCHVESINYPGTEIDICCLYGRRDLISTDSAGIKYKSLRVKTELKISAILAVIFFVSRLLAHELWQPGRGASN
jgi:hypothetical protein